MPIEFVNIAQSHEAHVRNYAIDGKHSPMVRTDESRIMQVLLGLLSNALKFTVEGSVKVIARIFRDEDGHDGERIEISVQDTGIGVSKDNQKKLFKLFGFI